MNIYFFSNFSIKKNQIQKYATLDFAILCVAKGRGLNVFSEAITIVSCGKVAFLRRKDNEMNKIRSSCNESW